MTATKKTAAAPHVLVKALAGCGKTTTAVEALNLIKSVASNLATYMPDGRVNRLPSPFKPSAQQKAIFDAVSIGPKPLTIAMVAFNKDIATDFAARVPMGVDAMTMHSLGNKAVKAHFGWCKVNGYRTRNLIEKHLGEVQYKKLVKESFPVVKLVEEVVSLYKQTLTDWNDAAAIDAMIAHYDIPLNGDRTRVLDIAAAVMLLSTTPNKDKEIDFDDMIWLPVYHAMKVVPYDLLIVDECQDLNRARQALALMFGRRLMLIGDENQAIYGFAGADAESMVRMEKLLSDSDRGCMVLPLTETRRCGKAIVEHARQDVPDFSAHVSCPAGEVRFDVPVDEFEKTAQAGDMVLCRTNAPLVRQAFRWIKERVPCFIRGRDIGKRLATVVEKSKATTIADLFAHVEKYRETHVAKELAKKNPSDNAMQAVHDTCDCIILFATDCKTVADVIANINDMFSDTAKANSRELSSIHKAKGREANTVWILRSDLLPGPWAKLEWEVAEELHLRYVARTRAIHSLRYVRVESDKQMIEKTGKPAAAKAAKVEPVGVESAPF